MKQTLHPIFKACRSGSLFFSFALISTYSIAQTSSADSVQTDTLETNSFSRGLFHGKENYVQLDAKHFNKGLITSPADLLTGHFAGLRVIPGEGQPGAATTLKLNATYSAFGRSEPLILLDGLPVENLTTSNFTAFLNSLNPHDIESISFEKNDAGIAVYGARAANGIIYITTKAPKNSSILRLNFTSTAAVSELRRKADILSADEFRNVVLEELANPENELGSENTDWQDVIYRKAFSHDQHLSLSGSLFRALPFRLSAGHLKQQGILKNSESKRNTIALSLNPSMLQDHLKLNINLRAAKQHLNIADRRAINAAWAFNPTKPVYESNNKFGGYYIEVDENGYPQTMAPRNPLSMLEQQQNRDETKTWQGQARLQYNFHFLPALQLNLLYGLSDASNEFSNEIKNEADRPYYSATIDETNATRRTDHKEVFLTYELPATILGSNVSILAGASHTKFKTKDSSSRRYYYSDNNNSYWLKTNSELLTLFSKLALEHKGKYGITLAYSEDISSVLPSSDDKTATYGLGASWNILKESFMSENSFFSSLTLNADYKSFENKGFKRNMNVNLVSPDLSAESINNFNTGISFGILADRLKGKLSFVQSRTDDMFLTVSIYSPDGPATYLINDGGVKNSGLEVYLDYNVVQSNALQWVIGANFTYNNNEVTELPDGLSLIRYNLNGEQYPYFNNGFALEKGSAINSFILLEHNYDNAGRPVQNSYKNGPNSGQFIKHSAEPSFTFGISSSANYKNFDLGILLRGSAGNYVYNSSTANIGYLPAYERNYLTNVSRAYLEDKFTTQQSQTHHYLENASFARMEYIQLGYNFGDIINGRANLRLTGSVQNAFVITKYSGQDPEVAGGVDYGQYPRPRTYSLGLNLTI